MILRKGWFILLVVLLAVSIAAAQPNTCQTVVVRALGEVGNNCATLTRNEACYGNFAVRADFNEELPANSFARPADTVAIASLTSLRTSPLDLSREEWGIGVMNVQADVPATLPGQAVLFVLLGDSRVDNDFSEREDRTPMQAFYFSGGIGPMDCDAAPSTLAIRSPEGITVNLTLNGLDIALGSLVTLIDNQNNTLTATVHEGQMVAVDTNTTVSAGQSVDLTLDSTRTITNVSAPRPATAIELALNAPVTSILDALDGDEVYTVQPGDTMFSIARRYETCVSALAAANGIMNVRMIRVGQQLIIPDDSSDCGALINDVPVPAPILPPSGNVPVAPPGDIPIVPLGDPPIIFDFDIPIIPLTPDVQPPPPPPDDDDDDDDGDTYGVFTPDDAIYIRLNNQRQQSADQWLGASFLMFIVFGGVWMRRKQKHSTS